ncbi:MAG: hypothetical protein BACD_00172 [Bacteroides rodentium]
MGSPEYASFWEKESSHWKGKDKPAYAQFDFETRSGVDIKKCGGYRYIFSDDFEPLLLAVAFDDDEPFIIDLISGEAVPDEVWAAVFDPDIKCTAWNAQFERTIFGRMAGYSITEEREKAAFNKTAGLSPDSWFCTMVWAASLSLPLSLKNAAAVLKTGEQKDRAGEALIRKFSVPKTAAQQKKTGSRWTEPKEDPDAWEQFKRYCLQDVRTERDIRKKLEKFPMPEVEWEAYHCDQRINDRGVLIDRKLVNEAIILDSQLSETMAKRAYELTDLDNPNSVSQLKDWLERRGIDTPSLGKKDVENLIKRLEDSTDQEALDMMKLRLQMSKSSVKKYQAAERYMCDDDRARGLFQFNGASHTHRFAGRGIQLQNLYRNSISTLGEARELVKSGNLAAIEYVYGNAPDILAQLIRTMLIPKEGHEFIVADFSAIEARVLAWEAGEEWTLDSFRKGKDLYCATASQMFGVPVEKHGENSELRQKGKIATLACGYQGGSGALISMGALDMGLKEDELPDIISGWREANPHVVQYWWDVQEAAIKTVQDHDERTVERVTFRYYAGTLWLELPSGRRLAYLKPRILPNKFGHMSLTFEGSGSGEGSGGWGRQETYGGKLVENITQSIARDLLVDAMLRMEKAGLKVVAHVHDEVIIESPIGRHTIDEVCSLMSENPDWAEGLPLAAAGYSGSYYYKD